MTTNIAGRRKVAISDADWHTLVELNVAAGREIAMELENEAGGAALTAARLQILNHKDGSWRDWIHDGGWDDYLGSRIIDASWESGDASTAKPDGLAADAVAWAHVDTGVPYAVRLQVKGNGATITGSLNATAV